MLSATQQPTNQQLDFAGRGAASGTAAITRANASEVVCTSASGAVSFNSYHSCM